MATPVFENDSQLHLRWYEVALIRWLLRSPRIERIIIQLHTPPNPEDGAPSLRVPPDAVRRLEALYRSTPEDG